MTGPSERAKALVDELVSAVYDWNCDREDAANTALDAYLAALEEVAQAAREQKRNCSVENCFALDAAIAKLDEVAGG